MRTTMRTYHRYLGFFLAGIMAVYAISGIILIFRDIDFLKQEVHEVRRLAPGLTEKALGAEIRIKGLRFHDPAGELLRFEQGTYNSTTGEVDYTTKRYPWLIDRLTQLHKANTGSSLFFLNIFFGISLLFFVVSAFWMYMPSSGIFKKGMYFVAAGILLTLLMLWV